MQVVEQASARDFAAAAVEMLSADQANNTLLISTLDRALRADGEPRPWWGAIAFERSRPVAGLLRDRAGAFISTGTPRAARALGRALRTAAWQQSLVGPAAMANECARALRLPARTQFELQVHRLTGAPQGPSHPPSGRMRAATAGDAQLLMDWAARFREEARLTESEAEIRRQIGPRIERDQLRLWIGETGQPQAFAGALRIDAACARIAPVYTEPAHRRRAVGQALVAAYCAELQAAGATTLLLFTDASNPTSNALYARVGFVPQGRHVHLIVTRPTAAAYANG